MDQPTEIELTSVLLDDGKLTGKKSESESIESSEVRIISTQGGDFRVTVRGDPSKPAIVTLPEVGLSSHMCYDTFFSCLELQPFLKLFCIYHVELPGQWEEANDLPDMYVMPSLDELARHFSSALDMLSIKFFHGVGVGIGANIMLRYATFHGSSLLSMTLVNGSVSACGWVEWARLKYHIWQLASGLLPDSTEQYLLWMWLGDWSREINHDLLQTCADQINHPSLVNRRNLAKLLEAYGRRTDVSVLAPTPLNQLKCQTLLVCGDFTPNVDEVAELNSRLDPSRTQFVKLSDTGGMPLFESPAKVAEAFVLFFQGMGYAPHLPSARGPASLSAAAASIAAARSRQVEQRILQYAENPDQYTNRHLVAANPPPSFQSEEPIPQKEQEKPAC